MEQTELVHSKDLDEILEVILHRYGYDFSGYAKGSLLRRVNRFAGEIKAGSAYDLKYTILNNETIFRHFLQEVTVNVTELFRDPLYYKAMREKILPVLASYPIIKIWHAGCSSGEEVFSMCILLHEAGLLNRARIYATDINPSNLDKAKSGILPLRHMKEYTANYQQSGGKHEFSDYYTARYDHAIIKEELRTGIVFSQHNLVSDNVFNEFQLICCRNVMIYFNKQLQDRVLRLFHESLSSLGFLTLGLKETLQFSSIYDKFEPFHPVAKMVIIGGSAGSIDVIVQILQSLPKNFQVPIVLVIHRMKNTASKLDKMLGKKTGIKHIAEPEDKEPIRPGMVYLAPQNYHLLAEADHTFSLDYSEPVNYSRPSIDLSFESFANLYGKATVAIVLSGANTDGAAGLKKVIACGGMAVIQAPETAEYPAMPKAAAILNNAAIIRKPEEIVHCILHNV
jgi:chemotaxis protein methyltransferase CheR